MQEKLQRIRCTQPKKINWEEVGRIQAKVAKMPVLDARGADEIIGYNEFGHFD